jgi:hypothetical protein
MPTIVIENMPGPLYEWLERRAEAEKRAPEDTVLSVLESAFRTVTPVLSEPPPPSGFYLPTEISAPFDIPWPEGERVQAVEIPAPLPTAHDFPVED